MRNTFVILLLCLILHVLSLQSAAEQSDVQEDNGNDKTSEVQEAGTVEMLTSLLDVKKSLKDQIALQEKRLKVSTSESEKIALQKDIDQLDKQLAETTIDFERIATSVEAADFEEKKLETFNWNDELASLLEPAIKEMKRFTIKARKKSELKDKVADLKLVTTSARQAVQHLEKVQLEASGKQVQAEIKMLLQEWRNIEKRLLKKLELTEKELTNLKEQDISLIESSSNSMKTFFRDRGVYLILGVFAFFSILLLSRLLYSFIAYLSVRFSGDTEGRSFQIRLLYIIFQVLSVLLAIMGSFFVLYLAEDWFLLSLAIIFFLGFSWTIRQGLPRLWQQGRLMLNIGSVREHERLVLYGVPWRVDTINVFCKLVNPSLNVVLREPIESLIGLVSRPCIPEEPWFPCQKGDWVKIGDSLSARVVSLSHEQVELVELGGSRMIYPASVFLDACPVNLSQNFRISVTFGLSYDLQFHITTLIPETLSTYLKEQMVATGYFDSCLNLEVDFLQANTSSLDLVVLADFDGNIASNNRKIERAIQKWCVECSTMNNWEIPFAQLTIHQKAHVRSQLS
jgi:small-conductance mechanosensitive channel